MSNPSITRVVKYIRKGEAGEDAIAIQVSGENIVFTKVGQIAYVYVDAYKGQTQLTYQDDFYCSVLGETFYICDKNVYWGFRTADNRFYYRLKLLNKTDIDTDLPYTVTINGVKYKRNIHISTAFDGDKGDRGPAVRGPQAWSDCAVGYSFQAGGDDEEWKDVVLYNGNYYSCILSHTKTASNYPTSTLDTSNGYWKLADAFEIVATKILLAQYALVKNLGVETIDMKDSSGNILFQAKDGNVICNTGTFKGINVTGTFKSEDTTRGNSVVIDAEQGGIELYGPSSVEDGTDLPSSISDTVRLARIYFETDPDSLARVAGLELQGYGKLRIDAIEGISLKGTNLSYYVPWETLLGGVDGQITVSGKKLIFQNGILTSIS